MCQRSRNINTCFQTQSSTINNSGKTKEAETKEEVTGKVGKELNTAYYTVKRSMYSVFKVGATVLKMYIMKLIL